MYYFGFKRTFSAPILTKKTVDFIIITCIIPIFSVGSNRRFISSHIGKCYFLKSRVIGCYNKSVFMAKAVVPAEFINSKTPCKRKIGNISVNKQRIFFFFIIYCFSVYNNVERTNLRFIAFFVCFIRGIVPVCKRSVCFLDGNCTCFIIPIRCKTEKSCIVIGHGNISYVLINNKRILSCI